MAGKPQQTRRATDHNDSDQEGRSRRYYANQNNQNFSLAGMQNPPPPYRLSGNAYVDEEYAQYNPHHGKPPSGPVWALSRPLPRIVRPGMRRNARARKTAAYEPPQNGPTSVIPQLKRIPTRGSTDSKDDDPDRASIHATKEQRKLDHLHKHGNALSQRAYGNGGIPKTLQRSISTDAGLRHYAGLQHAAREIDSALDTKNLANQVASNSDDALDLAPNETMNEIPINTSGMEDTTGTDAANKDFDNKDFDPLADDATIVEGARTRIEALSKKGSFESERSSQYPDDDDDDDESEDEGPQFLNTWARLRYSWKEFFAEWLGMTVGMTIGLSGAMVRTISPNLYGNVTTSSFSWGLGFMIAIYIAGGVSGAHLNPCISIILSIYRGFPARQCTVYIIAQLLGAFTGGAIVYGLYHDAIMHFNGNLYTEDTGIVFYTQPKPWVSAPTAFFNEFVGTAILTGSVLALGDDANAPAGAGMGAFIIGLLVTVLSMAFGFQTGGCFNPARDLGPRLVAFAAGYGPETFTAVNWWWAWGPWGATLSGALVGGFIYDAFIFTGGESPINYPSRRRKRAFKKWQAGWLRRLGLGHGRKSREVMRDLEKQAKQLD